MLTLCKEIQIQWNATCTNPTVVREISRAVVCYIHILSVCRGQLKNKARNRIQCYYKLQYIYSIPFKQLSLKRNGPKNASEKHLYLTVICFIL